MFLFFSFSFFRNKMMIVLFDEMNIGLMLCYMLFGNVGNCQISDFIE